MSSVKTGFSVPLSCQDCCHSIGEALRKLQGFKSFSCDLEHQEITVEATTPFHQILEAIESTGRPAWVCGQGEGHLSLSFLSPFSLLSLSPSLVSFPSSFLPSLLSSLVFFLTFSLND